MEGRPVQGRLRGPGRAYAGPAAAVIAGLLALEIGWGANAGSALLFALYELAFVVLPGWLVYRLLSSRPGAAIRQLALGWALGTALEVFAFMATAALDARILFSFYPLVVVAVAAPMLARRRRRPTAPGGEPLGRRAAWTLAAVCLAAMALVALSFFTVLPLPGGGTRAYFRDYTFHLGLAAEALHHWPIQDPNVIGEPFPYHYFAHIHMAAATQITGIDLPLVYFRLFPLPVVVLSVLLFVTAGRAFSRSAWVGLAAAGLTFFVADLQLQTTASFPPFFGVFIRLSSLSPSALFGLPVFLALVIVVGEAVASRERLSPGDWAVVAILAAAATNSKVVILPLLLGALGLFAAGRALAARSWPRREIGAGAILLVALLITYMSQYRGHSSGLGASAFGTTGEMPAVVSLKQYFGSLLSLSTGSALLVGAGAVVGLAGLMGPQLAGLAWTARLRRRYAIAPAAWWLAAVLAAAILIVLFADSSNGAQLYFLIYGLAAGWLLAADGLRRAWRARPSEFSGGWGRPAALGIGWAVALVAVMRAPLDLDLFAGSQSQAQTYLFWYVGLALTLAALALAARRVCPARAGWSMGAFLTVALLVVGVIGTVSNIVVPALQGRPAPQEAMASQSTLTPGRLAALDWIRDHTPTGAVLAVNNSDPFNFQYAAFAERRVFLEGWGYSRQALDDNAPTFLPNGPSTVFPDRYALNARAFAGDTGALSKLANDYGVRYLVVDSSGGVAVDAAALARAARPVYHSPEVTIYKIRHTETG